MIKLFRLEEYKVLGYRVFLAYVFYFIARLLFYGYTSDLIAIEDVGTFLQLAFHGLAFDTAALIYINSLFLLLSILPLTINTTKGYQQFLFYVYFITNLIAYAMNFVDFIYYRFIYSRTTVAVLGSVEHETNKMSLFFRFLLDYWHVFFLFLLCAVLWIFLYKKVRVDQETSLHKLPYFVTSIVVICVLIPLCIGGVRGDFKHSTRPINLVDANRHVSVPVHADVVLNTPFTIIRTIGKDGFQKMALVPPATVAKRIQPIKQFPKDSLSFERPNVVIFIIESYGREYFGAMNKDREIKDYVGYTPFLDSLAQHSLIFPNAFANGRKSIHGMASVLAGIPSFKVAFTSTAYANQPIQSVVSAYNDMGYETSFFHGAPNGSMGFLGFGNILGYDKYYGKTEYDLYKPDATDFDGFWGIWDEPFLDYMASTLSAKTAPFMSTVFTLSSHSPFIIPEYYEGKFPKGTLKMHQCVGYTDYAIRKFFEKAKEQSWFQNTLFVFTADHGNEVQYDYYKKSLNRMAVPILFYHPDAKEFLVGQRDELAQQLDIYPTLLDLSGYEKPIRSWGRSLMRESTVAPFLMTSTGSPYYIYAQGDYICTFDGKEIVGFYDIEDKSMKKNLIPQRNAAMDKVAEGCRAFMQDYMARILDRKLTAQ